MTKRVFEIRLSVPLGDRYGKLKIEQDRGQLCGELDLMGKQQSCSGTLLPDGSIEFHGKLKSLLRSVDYTAQGTLNDSILRMVLLTNRGHYPLFGREVNR